MLRATIFLALVAAALAGEASAQVRAAKPAQKPQPSGHAATTAPVTRTCVVRDEQYYRMRADLEARLAAEHQLWHRTHHDERNYLRQHEDLHQRLDNARARWHRTHSPQVNRCDDLRAGGGAHWESGAFGQTGGRRRW